MAKLDPFIPFIILFETGVAGNNITSEELYYQARQKGLAYDPDDKGGHTMVGITHTTYKEYCKRKGKPVPTAEILLNMPFEEWHDILKTMFWDRWQADNLRCQSIAEFLVDWVWTSGTYGITLPQQVLSVNTDGVVGPKTIAAVNSSNPVDLFAKLKQSRIAYIERICRQRPANRKFRNGWLRRINSLTPP